MLSFLRFQSGVGSGREPAPTDPVEGPGHDPKKEWPAVKGSAFLVVILTTLLLVTALAAATADPVVTITAPQAGITVVSNTLETVASYSSSTDAAIERLFLIVDGAVMQEVDLDPPQTRGSVSLTWTASYCANGAHELTVRALDTEGRAAETSLSIWLQRTPQGIGPVIRLTSPTAGQTVSGVTPVEVETDRPSLVRYVVFLVDDTFKAMSNVRPYTYFWDTTSYLNGLHRVQARAHLAGGAESLASPLEVLVNNPSGATAMRAASSTPTPEPMQPPARAGSPVLPPPMHTESLAPEARAVRVADPELALPGTAPFVSPSGNLIRPPSPLPLERSSRVAPIQIAMLPSTAVEEPVAGVPAATAVATPPAPTVADPARSLPASSEPLPITQVEPLAVGDREPSPAPTHPATGPAFSPEPVASASPITIAATADAPQTLTAEPAAPSSASIPSAIQVALLPPRPAEPAPTSRVAAEPAPQQLSYAVRSGDCLWSIAAEYHVSPGALAAANNLSISDPIHPGQRLVVPAVPVYFDGHPLSADAPTTIANGLAIVPFRTVIEEAGGSVTWEPEARQASASAGGHSIAVTIGSDQAGVDGATVAMGAPAALRCDRTVVPLRFLGDILDLVLQYEGGVIHIASAH